jgi:hypothetical protein
MDRNNTNSLFDIIKISAIFIAMFQEKVIFDLRSDNLKLNEGLTQSTATKAQISILVDKNRSQIAKIAALRKEVAASRKEQKSYLSQNKQIDSLKQYISVLRNNRDENIKLQQKVDRLLVTNKQLTERLTGSENQLEPSAEEARAKATAIAVRDKLLTLDRFKSLVMGKTRSEVIKVMGKPDEINDYYDEGKPISSWKYQNRIKHPGSYLSGKGNDPTIYFNSEVVDRINFD